MSEFIKTLNVLEQATGYYWTCPLEWNSRQGKVLYYPPSKKLLPWLIVFPFCGFQVVTCTLVLALQFYGLMHLPLMNVLLVFAVGVIQAFAFLVEMAKLLCGKITAQVFGELLVLHRRSTEGNFILIT